jgi:hypothetical protein
MPKEEHVSILRLINRWWFLIADWYPVLFEISGLKFLQWERHGFILRENGGGETAGAVG